METKLNPEYAKIIDKIKNYLTTPMERREQLISNLNEVIEALKHLGSRPKLDESVEQFMDITTNMAKTYAAKNHDYGNSFEQSLDKFGLLAAAVRMGDKMNRIESLSKKESEVKDESIKDTLLDLANYAIMTVMWLSK